MSYLDNDSTFIQMTPIKKNISDQNSSPFNISTFSRSPGKQIQISPSKNIDPNDKCIVENCYNSRLVLPNGDKLLVCSLNCDSIIKGKTLFY